MWLLSLHMTLFWKLSEPLFFLPRGNCSLWCRHRRSQFSYSTFTRFMCQGYSGEDTSMCVHMHRCMCHQCFDAIYSCGWGGFVSFWELLPGEGCLRTWLRHCQLEWAVMDCLLADTWLFESLLELNFISFIGWFPPLSKTAKPQAFTSFFRGL